MPPKAEWEKQGVVFHTSDQLFAYGLKCPKNSVKNFMLCLEAYFLKHLLFEKKGRTGSQRLVKMTTLYCGLPQDSFFFPAFQQHDLQ